MRSSYPRDLLERLLRRNACSDSPEAMLIIAVFGQSAADSCSTSAKNRYHANRFLFGSYGAHLANLLGMDIEFIHKFLEQAREANPTKAAQSENFRPA